MFLFVVQKKNIEKKKNRYKIENLTVFIGGLCYHVEERARQSKAERSDE